MWFDEEGSRTTVTQATPGDISVPYLKMGSRKFTFNLGSGSIQVLNDPQKPGAGRSRNGFRRRPTTQQLRDHPG